MKRKNLTKGISAAMLAMALCIGAPAVAKATTVDSAQVYEAEVAQLGVAPAAPAIALKGTTMSGTQTTGWTITFPAVPKGQRLYFNVYESDPKKSESGYWRTSNNKEYFYNYSYATEGATEYTIYASSFTPGTKTVVAYLYDDDGYYDAEWYDGKSRADFYSPASNPINIKVSMSASVTATVKSTSIDMGFSSSSDTTGYEVYRKDGGKFKKIATVAKNTYTDKGLTSKTTYTYKVRPYYYNEETKKTIYGEYTQFERTTVGSPLKLKIALAGKKNVKLSWTKVTGAVKYEVYRANGSSQSDTVTKGEGNGFSSYRLIKTLSKKKKSYVDKQTSANQYYSYKVCAVLDNQKRVTVEQSASIDIAFDAPVVKASYTNASGAKTVEWDTVYGADGYILERYDETTEQYVLDRKLGKGTKKLTIPAPSPLQTESGWKCQEVEYRLYASKGSARSDDCVYISVSSTLGTVANVSAKKVANGIQVSWSAVPGAAYYRVYRTTAGKLTKNNDAGYYPISSGSSISEYVGVVAPTVKPNTDATDTTVRYYQNFAYAISEFQTTSMIDYSGVICYEGDTADEFMTVGPQSGVTYQYYVIAYAAEQYEQPYTIQACNTATHEYTDMQIPDFKSSYSSTFGCKKLGEATFTAAKAPGKAKIKSVKSAKKKQATITINKVKNATSYKIYRSTKKKGTYACVGTTTKTKYTDTGLSSKKTYYYKVVAVSANEAGADVNGAASKVKSVKVK